MNVPESWLRSFCDPTLSGRELADKLTMAGRRGRGLRAGRRRRSAASWSAKCSSVEKHPNADKLTVCKVKAGKETLQVVCGAPNVRVGMKAPLRRRKHRQLKSRHDLRGVRKPRHAVLRRASSASPTITPGLLELPADAKPGADARALLGLDDHVLTLKLTPNRADCLSVLGVAREVSAMTGAQAEAARRSRRFRRRARPRIRCASATPKAAAASPGA